MAFAIGIPLVNGNPTIPNRGTRLSPEQLILLAALLFICAFLFAAISVRRTVRTKERQFITHILLFGRFRCVRLRWKVREGDYLAVFTEERSRYNRKKLEFDFQHTLCVCRSRRRQVIAVGHFTSERVVPGMEIVAERVAKLVDIPFVGYRQWKGFWWL